MPDGPSTIFYILVLMLIVLIIRDAGVFEYLGTQITGLIDMSAMALEGRPPS